jgi:DNA-binding LytR/AlgR family response regulator
MIVAHDDCFVFFYKSETFKINYADILYLEQDSKKLWIEISEEGKEQVTAQGNIRDISDNLESRFFQCHSYLIINLKRVVSMSSGTIVFDNGETKHLGRDAFFKTRKAFLNQSRDGI